jgi:hypothetical protein
LFLVIVTGVVNGFNSYAKLGLALNLNPLANGGFERSTNTRIQANIQEPSLLSPAMNTADDDSCIPSGFGRILRDDTGNIIGFEASKTEERSSLEVAEVEGLQLDADVDQTVHQRWAAALSSSGAAQIDPVGKRVLRGEFIRCWVNVQPGLFAFLSWPIIFFEKLHAAMYLPARFLLTDNFTGP